MITLISISTSSLDQILAPYKSIGHNRKKSEITDHSSSSKTFRSSVTGIWALDRWSRPGNAVVNQQLKFHSNYLKQCTGRYATRRRSSAKRLDSIFSRLQTDCLGLRRLPIVDGKSATLNGNGFRERYRSLWAQVLAKKTSTGSKKVRLASSSRRAASGFKKQAPAPIGSHWVPQGLDQAHTLRKL